MGHPAVNIAFNLKDDAADYPVSGTNPTTTTAISSDATARIKALLAPYAAGAITITQP